jgi:glycerol uptake facilitator-like aquaporin
MYTDSRLPAGPGNALLGNTIPTGAILVVIITIFGPISGALFNPAVTAVSRCTAFMLSISARF